MSYPLIITPDAARDIEEACAWYDEQQIGVGKRFVLAVRLRLEDILRSPLLPRPFGRKAVRKLRVPHWPYSIYYRIINEKELRIVAVVHGARDPKYLNYRLR
jgi:plasmid stabilization system protein ParE